MFTNTKVASGYFLEGSGFDKAPNYERSDLSQQPKWVSREATDAIAAWSARAQSLANEFRRLQANDQIIATRDLAAKLEISDNTREVNGVKIQAMDGDIRLSIGDKVQIIPKNLFERYQDTFINQFATNNGVTVQKWESPQVITVAKAPAARPAHTVAAAPALNQTQKPASKRQNEAAGPAPITSQNVSADSNQNNIKILNAQINEIDKKITEYKALLAWGTVPSSGQLGITSSIGKLEANKASIVKKIGDIKYAENEVNRAEAHQNQLAHGQKLEDARLAQTAAVNRGMMNNIETRAISPNEAAKRRLMPIDTINDHINNVLAIKKEFTSAMSAHESAKPNMNDSTPEGIAKRIDYGNKFNTLRQWLNEVDKILQEARKVKSWFDRASEIIDQALSPNSLDNIVNRYNSYAIGSQTRLEHQIVALQDTDSIKLARSITKFTTQSA